jgi:hypothetical protein
VPPQSAPTFPKELPAQNPQNSRNITPKGATGENTPGGTQTHSTGTGETLVLTWQRESPPDENPRSHPVSNGRSPAALTGEVYQFRKTWRLRYAPIDADDPHGGSVILVGAGLEQLQDGQRVHVVGAYMPSHGGMRFGVQVLQVLE